LGRLWPALDLHVPACDPQLRELVIAELDDFKLFAIHEDETLRAFFPDSSSRDAAAAAVARDFRSSVFVQRVDVEDEDWAARSQAHLEPVTVGRLVISPRPLGEPDSAVSTTVSLFIPPSMGFGTGHHATTRLMLEALQTLELVNRDVLDIGCGSAILAIAAVKLGARHAEAIDLDRDALEAAADNVRINDVSGLVRLRSDDLSGLETNASIVLANLTGALLERSAERLAGRVLPGGNLLVSGYMHSEPAVVPALQAHLTLERTFSSEEWCCAIFSRSTVRQG